jgi:predicted nucleic acid-binding protein
MAMSELVSAVVCDAGPLIHLDELDSLSLLVDFDQILVPEQVWREVEQHRPTVLTHPDVNLLRTPVIISTYPSFQTLAQSLSLGLGEQAALSLMYDTPEAIFLTDDAAARLAAMTLGYRVHGSIGILLRAIRRQQRTQAEILTLLHELPARSTLYLRPSLLQDIIRQLTSSP